MGRRLGTWPRATSSSPTALCPTSISELHRFSVPMRADIVRRTTASDAMTMNLLVASIPGFFVLASAAGAQERSVYYCVDAHHMAYSDKPCVSAGSGTGSFRKTIDRSTKEVATLGRQVGVGVFPLSATRLTIGMTDTQVLNLPTAGRPAQITRARAAGVWREQWVYRDHGTGEEQRTLYFENGRLVQAESRTASTAQVQAAIE